MAKSNTMQQEAIEQVCTQYAQNRPHVINADAFKEQTIDQLGRYGIATDDAEEMLDIADTHERYMQSPNPMGLLNVVPLFNEQNDPDGIKEDAQRSLVNVLKDAKILKREIQHTINDLSTAGEKKKQEPLAVLAGHISGAIRDLEKLGVEA